MIIKSYDELSKLFVGENKDIVKLTNDVKAIWTYNRDRKETGIGLYVNGEGVITLFSDNTFEMIIRK